MTPTGRTVHRLSPEGWVLDWLASPVWSAECDDLGDVVEASGSPWTAPAGRLPRWMLTNGPDAMPIKAELYRRHPLGEAVPAIDARAGGSVSLEGAGRGVLQRRRADTEGLLDWSTFARTPTCRTVVAVAQLELDQAGRRRLEVHSTGPVVVWIDGERVARHDDVSYMTPVRRTIDVDLRSGISTVVIASWQVAFRECRHVVGLRIDGPPALVVVPDPDADEFAAATAEAHLASIAAVTPVSVDGHLRLTGVPRTRVRVRLDEVSVPQTGGGRAVPVDLDADIEFDDAGRAEIELPTVTADADGLPYEASVTLSTDSGTRGPTLARTLDIASVFRVPYRGHPDPDADPAAEIVAYAASLPASPARALASADDGGSVSAADIAEPVALIDARGDCADFEALALLLLLARVPSERWEPGARETVERALLDFKYWIDQPGLDAMCYFTENHQFVWHVTELAAGTRFADRRFTNTGRRGSAHLAHGRALAIEWMRRKLDGGFSEFESNAYVAINCFSLAAAAELGDAEVASLAKTLLDLVLAALATSAWRGIHATAHGRSYTRMLRSARMEETGPLLWLTTGMGSLNPSILPALALATSPTYRVPDIVEALGRDAAGEWSYRTVNRGRLSFELDLLDRPYRSAVAGTHLETVALGAVEDYRVGAAGLQEHVWTVALGPETQVFATLAAAASRSGDVRPNAWSGNLILPRVRMHDTSLLALYAAAPLGTPGLHAWFPAPHFDEVVEVGMWLCGRLGDGYVAIGTEGGFRSAQAGPEPRHEWYARGRGRWMTAAIGSAGHDGDFAAFVDALGDVAAIDDPHGGPVVSWRRRGEELLLDDRGLFTIDGQVVPDRDLRLASPAGAAGFAADVVSLSSGGLDLRIPVR